MNTVPNDQPMITPPDDDALLELLRRHWPVGDARLRMSVSGTNNLTRIVVTDRPIGVLRLYQNLDHDRVLAEHRLLARLAGSGLPYRVPAPWSTFGGATVIDSRWGAVSVIDWIDGDRPDLDRPDALRAAGRALAELDVALADVPTDDAPFDWLGTDIRKADLDHGLVAALGAAGLRRDRIDWLHDHVGTPIRTAGLPVQVIHCDFAASNLLAVDGKITGFLDFEVAGRDLRANDLAIMLFQSGCLDGPDWSRLTAALVAGYAEAVRLEPAEIMIVPDLIMARALGTVGWRATRWRAGVASLQDVADRIPDAVDTERWLETNSAELVEILDQPRIRSQP